MDFEHQIQEKSSHSLTLKGIPEDDVGRISYGTAAQLRSVFLNIGIKKLYIFDLTRAKGTNDKIQDLMSALEDAKTGTITNATGQTLGMDPPHILVSSNYYLPEELLSKGTYIESQKTKNLSEKHLKKSSSGQNDNLSF